LITTDSKLVSECRRFLEIELKNNEQSIPSAPVLTITTHEDKKLWAMLQHTLNLSNMGWMPINKGAAIEQLQLKSMLSPGVEIVWNNYLKTFYVLYTNLQTIHIIGDEAVARVDTSVVSAIIEWATQWLYHGVGWIPMHSSAVSGKGCGILFLGDEKAGKTSTLLAFLENGGYEFVANDRVFIRKSNGKCQIIGLPFWFNIRQDTVKYFQKLRSINMLDKTEKQILSAFGVKRQMIADLSLMFFVRFNSSLKESQINKLTPEEVQERLMQNLLNHEQSFLSGMFRERAQIQLNELEELCKTIPGYSIIQNIENLSSTVRLVERLVRRADI
jgi:hypothetical protein